MGDSDGGTTRDRQQIRTEALRALAGATPGSRAVEDARRAFGGERALVLAVHQRWQVTLLARLDQVLEDGAAPPHDAVAAAVAALSEAMPGCAALLREHADDPRLDAARRRLAGYLAQACGCGRPHPLVAPAEPAVGIRRERATVLSAIRRGVGHCRLRCAARRAAHSGELVPRRN